MRPVPTTFVCALCLLTGLFVGLILRRSEPVEKPAPNVSYVVQPVKQPSTYDEPHFQYMEEMDDAVKDLRYHNTLIYRRLDKQLERIQALESQSKPCGK